MTTRTTARHTGTRTLLTALMAVATAGLATTGATAQPPTPVSGEVQVNTYTLDDQLSPAIGFDAAGNFVVVWESVGSPGTDLSDSSIQAQRFAADGTPLGDQFQVNSYTPNRQLLPDVAVASDGAFVVVWESYGSAGSDHSFSSVQARRYDAQGQPAADQVQVNSSVGGFQSFPAVAVGPDGRALVVWDSESSGGSDTSGRSIQARYLGTDGSPAGGELQINSITTSDQAAPDVAIDAAGRAVVVWFSSGGNSGGTDTSGRSIQCQRLAADGSFLGGEFQVNTYTEGSQFEPSVWSAPAGDFVVVWSSAGSAGNDASYNSIQGQRFAADGTPLGSEFQVNTFTDFNQVEPTITGLIGGGFNVAWCGDPYFTTGPDGDYSAISSRAYGGDGTPLEDEQVVNTYVLNSQTDPDVAADGRGNLAVVWRSEGSQGPDMSAGSIQLQRFTDSSALFSDGFESGDTAAWSQTIPAP